MKKIAAIAVLCIAMLLAVVGCGGKKASVESIAVTKNPKTSYAINDTFDPTGGELTVTMSDGDKEVIALDHEDVTIGEFDFSTHTGSSTRPITITYKEKTTSILLKVVGISSISVQTSNSPKLKYEINETFSRASGQLRVEKTNGIPDNIPFSNTDISILNFDSSTPGVDKPVTVSYAGKTTTIYVTVYDPAFSGIEIGEQPIMDYWTMDTFDRSTGTIIAKKTGGGAPDVIPLSSEDVVIKHDFSVRGTAANPTENSAVRIQYRGHEVVINVNLRSGVSGIQIKDTPQSKYLVYENPYTGYGSLLVTYLDGGQESVPISDSRVDIIGFDTSKGDLDLTNNTRKASIKFTYVGATKEDPEKVFETQPFEITIEYSEASEVMLKLNSLSHISFDYATRTMDSIDAQELSDIRDMFSAFRQLTSATSLSRYVPRIVGLAFAAEYMELYALAGDIAAIDLVETTYSEALALIDVLSGYDDDVIAYLADTTFNGYLTTSLQTISGTSVSINKIKSELENSQLQASRLGLNIPKVSAMFAGMADLPNADQMEYFFDFKSVTTLGDTYEALMAATDADVTQFLPVLDAWRPGYLAILLEYLYQLNDNSIHTMVTVPAEGEGEPTTKEEIEPQIKALLSKWVPTNIYNIALWGAKNINIGTNYINAQSTPNALPYFTYHIQMKDAVEELYYSAYPSAIAVYEQYPLIPIGFDANEQPVYVTCQYIFDSFEGDERTVYNSFIGEYAPPRDGSELKDFFNIFLPVMEKYIDLFHGAEGYEPTTAAFIEDIDRVRDAFYSLSSYDQFIILTKYDSASLSFYFSYMDRYVKSIFSSTGNEYKAYETVREAYWAYIVYCANRDSASLDTLKAKLAEYDTARLRVSSSNEVKFTNMLKNELACILEIKSWVNEISVNPPSIINEIYNEIIYATNRLSEGRLDETMAIFIRLDAMVQELTGTALTIFEDLPLDSFDNLNSTYNAYYLDVKNTLESYYVLANLSTDERAIFDQYMLVIGKLQNARPEGDPQYELGDSEFNTDVSALRELFFDKDITLAESMNFVTYGHDIIDSLLLWMLLEPYSISKLADDDKNEAAANALYTVIYNMFMYQAGRASVESLTISLEAYDGLYSELGSLQSAFATALELEIDYVNKIRAFVATLTNTGNAEINEFIRLLSVSLEKYSSGNSEIITFDAYFDKAIIAYNAMDTLVREAALDVDIVLGSTPKETRKAGEAYETLLLARDVYKAMRMSDDSATRELYEKLSRVVFEFCEDVNYVNDPNFAIEMKEIMNTFMGWSAFQQGSFLKFQSGIIYLQDGATGINFYNFLLEEVYIAELNNVGTDEEKIAMENAIVTTLNSSIILGLYLGDMLSSNDLKAAFSDAETAYAALKTDGSNTKARFDASDLGDIYVQFNAVYHAFLDAAAADSNGVVMGAIDITVRVVEARKLAVDFNDYTYLNRYLGYSASIIPNISGSNLEALKTITYDDGTTDVSLYDWYFVVLAGELDSIADADEIGSFFSKYTFAVERFLNAGGAIDPYFFTAANHAGEVEKDIEMLLEFYDLLTPSEKLAFDENYGYMFRTMLRYYDGSKIVTVEDMEAFVAKYPVL